MISEQKLHFTSPSPAVAKQMLAAGFTLGIPTEAGWFLAAVRSNDVEECYYVIQLWFNPMSHRKWWVGGGYVSNKAEEYWLADQVRAYSKLPSFPCR